MRSRQLARSVAVLTLAAAGCTPSNPGDEGCGWPTEVHRNAQGVLYDRAAGKVFLVNVASGLVEAACAVSGGAGDYASVPLEVAGESYYPSIPRGSLVVRPVDPALDSVADDVGVLELSSAEATAVGGQQWVAAGLPGQGRVLLAKRPANGIPNAQDYERASSWCLLPSKDSDMHDCAPITYSAEPGAPAVHEDGTVGWATRAAVPLKLGDVQGWAQTDGVRLTRAEVLPPGKKTQGSGVLLDASGKAGLIDEADLATALNEEMSDPATKRIAWFTTIAVTPHEVTGKLFRSTVTTEELARKIGRSSAVVQNAIYGARVLDDGSAVVIAVGNSSVSIALVRIGLDGEVRTLASLGDAEEPRIIWWPQ